MSGQYAEGLAEVNTSDPGNNLDSKNGGSSGSGSKSSSKSAEKEAETLDALESEQDIYHDINEELEDIQNKREAIADSSEDLYGSDYTAAIQEEINLYKEENEALEEKLDLQNASLAAQQEALETQGVEFDEDGNITNYNSALSALEEKHAQTIAEYNSMSAAQQETEAGKKLKAEAEAVESAYETLKSGMDNYEDS